MTVIPCTPNASMVFRSAWIPAPPPESEPAMVSTRGGACPGPSVGVAARASDTISGYGRVTAEVRPPAGAAVRPAAHGHPATRQHSADPPPARRQSGIGWERGRECMVLAAGQHPVVRIDPAPRGGGQQRGQLE